MSGPNPPGPESFEDEPDADAVSEQPTEDVKAYSAPESEQFTSGPYIPADASLYDYDAYSAAPEYEEPPVTPRWPWIVGVAAILAAVALVASVTLLVFPSLTSKQAAPAPSTTTSPSPPVQDEITTTTPPPPPPTTTEAPPPPPPPSTETVTVTPPPPPPPAPSSEAPPPPPPAPATTSAPPATTSAPAAPRQVTYTVTGTKAPGDIISITYTDASGRSRTQRNVYIPWAITLTPISQSDVGSLEASSFFRVSRLNCSITASDGTVLSQRADNSPVTSC
ncbi:MAG TPA: MmpS family transport accessory protein [Mycobacterium sp.]|nr:MmpS family transport accessory protein [Mycobacterium sp.]